MLRLPEFDGWVASPVTVSARTGLFRHSNDPVIGYVGSASRGLALLDSGHHSWQVSPIV